MSYALQVYTIYGTELTTKVGVNFDCFFLFKRKAGLLPCILHNFYMHAEHSIYNYIILRSYPYYAYPRKNGDSLTKLMMILKCTLHDIVHVHVHVRVIKIILEQCTAP